MALFKPKRKARISPTYMVFMWFGSFILLGTILLMLPWAHLPGGIEVNFVDALFTSVSAACVTGLTVVNVANTFSFFGQLIILLLMEMGGMGIMSFASLGFRILGRKLSMQQQVATADAIYQNDAANEFKRTFIRILRVTMLVQAAGAIGMGIALIPHHWDTNPGFLVWSAIFHSASAFCNSGFTLYPDGLNNFLANIPFLLLVLVLVTLGGLGHIVLNELFRLPGIVRHKVKKPHYISLHTRVVLVMTALLICTGILAIWALGTDQAGSSLWQAIFETVSGRTAGFSIVSQAMLPLPSIVVMLLLMFVGGSPGSCAGGIKTTSLAIWIARIRANLRNDTNVNMFGYTIAPELVSRARVDGCHHDLECGRGIYPFHCPSGPGFANARVRADFRLRHSRFVHGLYPVPDHSGTVVDYYFHVCRQAWAAVHRAVGGAPVTGQNSPSDRPGHGGLENNRTAMAVRLLVGMK